MFQILICGSNAIQIKYFLQINSSKTYGVFKFLCKLYKNRVNTTIFLFHREKTTISNNKKLIQSIKKHFWKRSDLFRRSTAGNKEHFRIFPLLNSSKYSTSQLYSHETHLIQRILWQFKTNNLAFMIALFEFTLLLNDMYFDIHYGDRRVQGRLTKSSHNEHGILFTFFTILQILCTHVIFMIFYDTSSVIE